MDELGAAIKEVKHLVSGIVARTARRAKSEQPSTRPPKGQRQPPPQVLLLTRAVGAIKAMHDSSPSTELSSALEELKSALNLQMVTRAIAIMDRLKASGLSFTDEAEATRKELRTLMGLSPFAPISLEQALTEENFSPATNRERAIIHSIDKGLLRALGGRGEKYEAIIRSIAEGIAEESELQ